MLPSLQRSSPPNPFITSQPAKSVNPLTVNGKPPGALVICAPEVVQALNLSILMFPPFRYIT
jgi:hypothetical protein